MINSKALALKSAILPQACKSPSKTNAEILCARKAFALDAAAGMCAPMHATHAKEERQERMCKGH
jgi:hypothetical protein